MHLGEGHSLNWHRGTPKPLWMPYNTLIHTETPLMDFPKNFPDVNRVEVISNDGEEFVWDVWDECSKVRVSLHNNGKTLKIFLVKEN
jgi:hypothetical protein